MQPTIYIALLLLALVCFIVSSWQSAAQNWNRLVSIGFAVLTLALLTQVLHL